MPKRLARRAQVVTPFGEAVNASRYVKRRARTFFRSYRRTSVKTLKPQSNVYNAVLKKNQGRPSKFKFRGDRRVGYKRPVKRTIALRSEKNILHRFEKSKQSAHYRFIKKTRPSIVLSPLHFYRPTIRASVSAEDKER